MTVTAANLEALSRSPENVVAPYVVPLNDNMSVWGVDSAMRRAHFLAQVSYESQGFSRVEENFHYTHASAISRVWPRLAVRADSLINNPEALANAAYANRSGNGDEASGDGFKFAGKGLIQVTGKNNYLRIGAELDLDLLDQPNLLLEPENAVKSALAFWKINAINGPADKDDITAVTRKVNGGTTGVADRAILKHHALTLGL